MEIIFHSHAFKTHFHKKGSAPSLILKVRVFGTRKWLICVILENFKVIRRLKIQTGVSIIFCLDVSYMFMCQGPVGPPGADGERGLDGSKVKSCIILLIIIVLSFDHRVCL